MKTKNKLAASSGRMTRLARFFTGWAWRQETDLAESVALLEELHIIPGAMEAQIKQRPELAAWMSGIFAEMVAASPNYTEMRFDTRKPESWEWITVTVQKGTGKTPHTLRMDAEKQRDELRAILESNAERTHGCETCLRRTAPRPECCTMILPPLIIAFECENLIEP